MKGILISGPSGTGKTFLAKQIAKSMGATIHAFDGPKILPYVGEAYVNLSIFHPAEQDYKHFGDGSDLHVFIFDDFDIGNNNCVVNQALSDIHVLRHLNNVLIIAITNRKHRIAKNVLSVLQAHHQLTLPDENTRLEILRTQTAAMRIWSRLQEDVDLREVAKCTVNFTPAELAAALRSAISFPLFESFQPNSTIGDCANLKVTSEHLFEGIREVHPIYGVEDLQHYLAFDLIPHSREFVEMMNSAALFAKQGKCSARGVLSLLLEGPVGCGKTSIAASLAMQDFYSVKLITAEKCIGFTEMAKISYIRQVFEDSYNSVRACIIIDDIERLIENIGIDPLFSNPILQTIWSLLRKPPPTGRNLFILGTTSCFKLLSEIGLASAFTAVLSVPCVPPQMGIDSVLSFLDIEMELSQQVRHAVLQSYTSAVPIKKLLSTTERIKLHFEEQSLFC